MKKLSRLMTLGAAVLVSALSVAAQQPTAQQPAASAPQDDAAKVCGDLYTKWRESYKGDANQQKVAYEAGKEYLAKCQSDQYVKWVAAWVPKYEKAVRGVELADSFVKNDVAKSFELGKKVLAEEPDNVLLTFRLQAAGLTAGDRFRDDTLSMARKTLQLVEAGKADAADWKSIGINGGKDEVLGWTHYTLGFLNYKTKPAEAAPSLVKAVSFEGPVKKNATAYYLLSLAYQNSEYAPLAQDYQANCAGKDLTDECKLKFEKLNLVVDRVIDSLARAVALATDPKLATDKANWMKQLEGFYKFRHEDKTDGLNELIAGIQAKPLLLPSMQPAPTLPAPSTSPSTSTTPTGTGAAPASNTGATSSNGAAKPAAAGDSSSTAKPKP
jgi:hypothetical protein